MDLLLELNWFAVGQIILIDILLGGDNAILIALACRNLPREVRVKGIFWGTMGAIAIRISLISFAVTLLQVPYLKLAGGLLLFWIGVKLLADTGDSHDDVHASDRLLTAIKTIVIADLVMSVDNVVGVSSAAEQMGGNHQMALVVFGIAVSIPIIAWGSTFVLALMERVPLIVTGGAALLGYLAGTMVFTDAGVAPWIDAHWHHPGFLVPGVGVWISLPGLAGAAGTVIVGRRLAARQTNSSH